MSEHPVILKRLIHLAQRERLPHAIMLSGDEPHHLLTHAKTLIQYSFCKNRSGLVPCGECPSCTKMSSGVHPDFFLVEAEKKEIKIDQIRQAIHWIQLSPNESPEKFCIIHRAESLNRSSANSFLKTLEEPPPHGKILLISRSSDHLLPTIKSRVQIFRFPASLDPAEEVRNQAPEWMGDMAALFERIAPSKDIFELTSSLPNDREQILAFFEKVQRELLDRMKQGQDLPTTRFRKLEDLFDLTLRLEGQILRGYGNLGMALDRILLEWRTYQEATVHEAH